jgi:hypothetical protein
MCSDFKPLDQFYTRVKRYVCKRHHWLRIKATFEKKCDILGTKEAMCAWVLLKQACGVLGYEYMHIDKVRLGALGASDSPC